MFILPFSVLVSRLLFLISGYFFLDILLNSSFLVPPYPYLAHVDVDAYLVKFAIFNPDIFSVFILLLIYTDKLSNDVLFTILNIIDVSPLCIYIHIRIYTISLHGCHLLIRILFVIFTEYF